MFFKRECPHCGARNPKERMTCAECGAPLALGQVEGRPAKVETTEEPSESTREETVARWRRRQERDQAHSEELEREPWRMSKRIKEEDLGQRLVIVTLPGKQLLGILLLAAAIVIGVIIGGTGALGPLYWNLLIGGSVVAGLFFLGRLIGNKIAIDRPTQSLVWEARPFLLFKRRRVILFSDVRSMIIDYKPPTYSSGPYEGGSSEAWDVFLDIGGKKVLIDSTSNEGDMFALARGISKFIGKELIVASDKPESPTKTFDGDKLPRDWKL